MAIIRWNPLSEYRPRTSSFFDPFALFGSGLSGEDYQTGGWCPRANILEDDESVEIKMEIPGLAREDVNVNVQNRILTVSGERKLEKEEESYSLLETSSGNFSRSFRLGIRMNVEGIVATVENGILSIAIPKAPEAQPKQIEIKGS